MCPTKIVAADDHKIFLEGLKSLFVMVDNIDLMDVAENGDHLLSLIKIHRPDIALIDLSMPGASTEIIIQTVIDFHPDTQLLALTMHMEPQIALNLFALGLSGYVLKEYAYDELEDAINTIRAGEQYISPFLLNEINQYRNKYQDTKSILTKKEIMVLVQVAQGQSNKEIARKLKITERTVRFHLSNCFLKLEVNNRSSAVTAAIKLKLIVI